MKKPVLFLRIASGLTFLHAILHTVGGVFGRTAPGAQTIAAEAMKANQFLVFGNLRSFWDFYRGLGLGITIFLAAEAIIFWQLASLAKRESVSLQPILITFSVAYLVFAADSYFYFFFAPVITEILIAASLIAAIITAKPRRSLNPTTP